MNQPADFQEAESWAHKLFVWRGVPPRDWLSLEHVGFVVESYLQTTSQYVHFSKEEWWDITENSILEAILSSIVLVLPLCSKFTGSGHRCKPLLASDCIWATTAIFINN